MADLTVRAQALGGIWETIGVERAKGVWPENVTTASDLWGPTTASFDLRRDSAVSWPDVSAFTPVEIEEDGVVVWEGRVKETPARDAADGHVLNVQCEGWQYHLDDDLYQKTYIATDLTKFADMRSSPTAVLSATGLCAVGQVSADGGLSLSYPKDTNQVTNMAVGAYYDFGAGSAAQRVVLTWKAWGGGGSNQVFLIRGADYVDNSRGSFEDTSTGTLAGPTTTTVTFATPRRYLHLFLLYLGATNSVAGLDVFVQVTDLKVFADSSYESAGASALTAPIVIQDALDIAAPLLSTDRTQIDPSSSVKFKIPSLAPDGPKTPREIWNGVNAYHGYVSKVGVGRVPIFKPQPSAPVVEVGNWSAMEFQDASANSGADIYNRVIGTATGADGTNISIDRTRLSTTDLLDTASVTIPNPSFTTDTSGWTTTAGPVTRDTAVFDTAPASGAWATGLGTLSTFVTGTYTPGAAYVVQFAVKAATGGLPLSVSWGSGVIRGRLELADTPTTWTTYRLAWTPTVAAAGANLVFLRSKNSGTFNIDSVSVGTITPTIVDRRGFRRTYQLAVAPTMPADGIAVTQICDVWLDQHHVAPFRGSLTVSGDQAVREITSGRYLPPSALLNLTGEMIRLSDRIDPNTGGFGRDGFIAAVTYNPAANSANVTLDSPSDNLQVMLNRIIT